MRCFLFLLVCWAVMITLPSEEKKTGYNILWVRPVKVEQSYFIRQNLKINYQYTTLLQKAEIDKKSVYRDLYYEAKVVVIDINEKKIATCEKHNVIAFYELIDGKKVDLLSKGSSVIIRKTDNGKEVLVDNKVPEKVLLLTLSNFLELNAGGPTYNETMGECKNIMPGVEWDILGKNIIESYKVANINILPNEIRGKCKFEKVENNRLFFSGNFSIEPFRVISGKGRTLLDSKYSYQIFEIAPIDEVKQPIKISKITKHHFVETETGKDGIQYSTIIEKEFTINYYDTEKEMSE